MSEAYRVGVNYWPASSAMQWWRRFEAAEVDRDFARIVAAGGDLVRFFLLWEDFQPTPGTVSEIALDRLVTVADIARRSSLKILPTLFTGHMSGANFVPIWALGGSAPRGRFRVIADHRAVEREIRNWYTDQTVLEAQAILARECARALSGHGALWGWDLGNENSNCSVPPTRDDGLRWLDRMADAIRSVDPSCRITLGLHMEDLEEDRRIGPVEALVWCYADYAPSIWSLPPLDLAAHERHFGLWRWDGTPKPAMATLAEWHGRARATPPALDLPDAQRSRFYDAPRSTLIGLYRAQRLARPVL